MFVIMSRLFLFWHLLLIILVEETVSVRRNADDVAPFNFKVHDIFAREALVNEENDLEPLKFVKKWLKDNGIQANRPSGSPEHINAVVRSQKAPDVLGSAIPNDYKYKFNMVVFDYDDTLFPTSLYRAGDFNGFKTRFEKKVGHKLTWMDAATHFPKEVKRSLDTHAAAVREVLQVAHSLGQVLIITNAEMGWINMTLPLLKGVPEMLKSLEIPVVSARDRYADSLIRKKDAFASDYIENPILHPLVRLYYCPECYASFWKTRIFGEEYLAMVRRAGKVPNAIMSIGDMDYEIKAAMDLSTQTGVAAFTYKVKPPTTWTPRLFNSLTYQLNHLSSYLASV